MPATFAIKDNVHLGDIQMLHPNLIFVFGVLVKFCADSNIPLTVTSIMDAVSIRVSRTHKDGRAIDIRTKNLSTTQIRMIKDHLNKYNDLGAYSASDGKQRLVVEHVGTAPHIHIQVHP